MGSAPTILVIEDHPLTMKLVRVLLQRAQYTVLEAADAETGLQLTRAHHPDLILMDLRLPGMDGLTATRIIKEDPECHAIPVVVLTSYAMQGDEEQAIEAGCDGYILKLIDIKRFLDTIAQYLR